jgi:hypothetical protein
MNPLYMCAAITLNIYTAPAANTVVAQVPQAAPVYLMEGSLLRDWVFIGKPTPDGISPRGWVVYSGLSQCPSAPPPPEPEEPAS